MATTPEMTNLERAVADLMACDDPSKEQVIGAVVAIVGVIGLLTNDLGRIANALERRHQGD